MESKRYSVLSIGKDVRLGGRLRQKFDGPDKLTTLPDLDATGYSRVFITRYHTVPFTSTGHRFHHLSTGAKSGVRPAWRRADERECSGAVSDWTDGRKRGQS
jgi:hypothetical protein